MKIYFSKSTLGFYLDQVHGEKTPGDAVEISAELHQELLNGQAEGRVISADDGGAPVLVDQGLPPLLDDQAADR